MRLQQIQNDLYGDDGPFQNHITRVVAQELQVMRIQQRDVAPDATVISPPDIEPAESPIALSKTSNMAASK